MIKNIFKIVSFLLAIVVASILLYSSFHKKDPVSVVKANYDKKPLNFILEETNDVVCKMLIRKKENSAQAVDKNGNTHFFNDPGCMVLWLNEQKDSINNYKLWIYTLDTHRWIDAKIAHYGIRDKTIMGYGFGARERKKRDSISFKEMYHRMITNQTLLNPKIRKSLLEDNYDK